MSLKMRVLITLVIIAVVFRYNPFTLSLVTDSYYIGQVASLQVFYVWFFDIYLLLIVLLLHCPIKLCKRAISGILFVLTLLVSIELASLLTYRVYSGKWYFNQELRYVSIFEPHPYLVGVPKPNAAARSGDRIISHNSHGYRGREFDIEKREGIHRIVAIGGATTYCTGVSNGETWPEYLDESLGGAYEVINAGVPGYSTVENIIQTAFHVSDLQPDIVLYYLGWNDIKNMHVKNLQPDYSDFHGKGQYGSLKLPPVWISVNLASISLATLILQKFGFIAPTPEHTIELEGEISADIDERALTLYERNLRLLIALARKQDIVPVMIPQILYYERLQKDASNKWAPYVRSKDLAVLMHEYNKSLQNIAADEQVHVIDEALLGNFGKGDFVDDGHFSPQGNRKFAEIISTYIINNKLFE